ncbi:MAG: nascent polypeptide-associated complex protein [Nanoarchaeota archaeon]
MFGGLGGVNPAQMKAMMKQLGIKQEEVPAKRVIIEKEDGRIIIEDPKVIKMTMQGQDNWQITGEAREESLEAEISDDDVQLVIEKTGKSESEVRRVLNETKDIAEAIVRLS